MNKKAVCAKLPSIESVGDQMALRIKNIQTTIKALESLPPSLGSKWREGMVRYYSSILEELQSYGSDKVSPK